MQGITITVTGGSNTDNSEMCAVLQGLMQNGGFTNVSVDSQWNVNTDQDVVSAMRTLNPDLFDTPVLIEGTCEYDAIVPGTLMAGGAFIDQPPAWGMPTYWSGANSMPFFIGNRSLY